ncbi:IS200/IS605 family transposase OrfB [Candidatus Mancarchaeum acidiphilum]|uniref:IS200/IS605 family transposase OrfB n=1 Tax=Candidatus Mancarchaeum acidiphilum TaxID=1920749 RepID=A0A218NNU9_9ARCH|nr:RNA-guided endonuclease TnpB family protein [Candidatus Mancarchaeum acidiphilum]ASI14114.1 IS200/IS605 family transposase OrfB [Candidatus Mancarchaeum acidiphilum]
MEMIRAYKFRIYPDAKRQKEIDLQLLLSKEFYNLLLEKSIKSYKGGNKKLSMSTLNKFAKEIEKDKRFLQIYSQVRCEIKYRVLKAYKNFFRRINEKKQGKKVKAGFPRFKSKDRYYSITYPQDNGSFSIKKKGKKHMLRVSKLSGRIEIESHRPIEGKIKTLTIKKKAEEYFAIFTTITETEPPKIEDTDPVGIDMGLHSFVTTSDGMKTEKPKFVRKPVKHIARWQRKIARREKGSERREKAKQHLQNEWEHVAEQSNDFARKLSSKLVNSGYTSFAVEGLHIQNMVKNHNLAQSIYNASWNRFIQMLSYKAESAGMKVIKVDAKDTTQECSNCHHIKEGNERLTLGDRIYHCNVCGLTIDRDINASINILKRATLGQRGSHAQREGVRPQREAVLEELRTDKTHPLQDAVTA